MLCYGTKDERLCPDALHVKGYTLFVCTRLYCSLEVNFVHYLSQKDHLLLLFWQS